MKSKWVITCEHGGNTIPHAYTEYFRAADSILESHRGYDPGAYELFQLLAPELADFSIFSQTSRLLVELNRSLHHKSLFSAYTRPLPKDVKKDILSEYYFPYRKLTEEKIRQFRNEGFNVYHLSVHSFTPELNGEVRNADIGLLYDPARKEEKAFCSHWKESLKEMLPQARVRMNYPYQGKADGFTTYLRRLFPEGYLGTELEVNQKHAGNLKFREGILESLKQIRSKNFQ